MSCRMRTLMMSVIKWRRNHLHRQLKIELTSSPTSSMHKRTLFHIFEIIQEISKDWDSPSPHGIERCTYFTVFLCSDENYSSSTSRLWDYVTDCKLGWLNAVKSSVWKEPHFSQTFEFTSNGRPYIPLIQHIQSIVSIIHSPCENVLHD